MLDSFKEAALSDQHYQLVLTALKERKKMENLPPWHPAKAFKNEWNRLSIADGLIALDSYRLVVPHDLQPQIIEICHSLHGGIVKTRTYARSKYFWPQMNHEIATAVENCKKYRASDPTWLFLFPSVTDLRVMPEKVPTVSMLNPWVSSLRNRS